MSAKKISKQEILDEIEKIFSKKSPTQKDIKKIKNLAMSKNIKLKGLRKKFCRNCFTFFTPNNSEVRIKKQNNVLIKSIKCKNCGCINRWKMKN